jgi:hypothetical protein
VTNFAFVGLPVAFFVSFLVLSTRSGGDFAFDFRQFWQGANDVANGVSPYPTHAELAAIGDRLGPGAVRELFHFPYPAAAAVALVPFGMLPFGLASWIFAALLIAAVLASLWLLGVEDLRVYGLVLGTVAVGGAVRMGTLTPLLLLLLVVCWRWRDRRWLPAVALAAAIVLKLFLWPMLIWLAATGRAWTALRAAGIAVVALVVSWAAIGFDGMTLYLEFLRRLEDVVGDQGVSLVAFGVVGGLDDGVARWLPLFVGLPVLAAAVVLARRGGDERVTFSVALGAALLLTPIVWVHYATLLLIPLSFVASRLAWPWLLLLLFWLSPTAWNEGRLSYVLVAQALMLTIVALPAVMLRDRGAVPLGRLEGAS